MKYLLKSKRFPTNNLLLEYDDEGMLQGLQFQGGWNSDQKSYLLKVIPVESGLLNSTIGNSFWISHEMSQLEFIDFWNGYAYKVGNKKRAEKLWDGLTDIEKAQCMKSVKTYDSYLVNHPKMEKCYPETYLAQRRFESIYK